MQSDQTSASAMRLMAMRGGQHLVPGEPLPISHDIPREGSRIAPILLVLMCMALLQSVDALSFLAILLTRRLLGLSSIGVAISLVVALAVVPGGDPALQALPGGLFQREKARKARFVGCSGARDLHIFAVFSR